MLKSFQIENIKGLKKCIIKNSERINVICGKNNSGKSTLLEGIKNDDKRQKILTSNIESVDYIYNETIEYCHWKENNNVNELYKIIIKNTLESQDIWLLTDKDKFIKLLVENIIGNPELARHQYTSQNTMVAYDNFYIEKHSIILIPAKRKLELGKNLNMGDGIDDDGTGILNNLFTSKNKPENSEEKKIYKKICKAFNEISSGYVFDIFSDHTAQHPNYIALKFSNNDESWIDAQDCGLGLQDLLIILYFTFSKQYEVILIEEPENHMHPDMQRKLLLYLKNKVLDKQFFLTTHSNIFLNNSLVDKILFTYYEDSVKV